MDPIEEPIYCDLSPPVGREKEIHTTVPHLGEIPSEIGELDQLRVLNLAHNKFEGETRESMP